MLYAIVPPQSPKYISSELSPHLILQSEAESRLKGFTWVLLTMHKQLFIYIKKKTMHIYTNRIRNRKLIPIVSNAIHIP